MMPSSPLPSQRPLSERLYRCLLLSYPVEFRTVYCREMVQTFRDCYCEALQQQGRRGLMALWGLVLRDLAATACIEHIRAIISRWKRLLGAAETKRTLMFPSFFLNVAQQTDIGRKRASNEDNLTSIVPEDPEVLADKGALFVVADGMGGHEAGEVASELTVRAVSEAYYQESGDDIETMLHNAVRQANERVSHLNELRQSQSSKAGNMGTTCVAAVLRNDVVYVANVGDSRAYLFRGGELRQISQDHSLVADMVRAGVLTEEQALMHEKRNIITRCLGNGDVEIDTFTERVEEGDALVLCTDGLSQVVGKQDLLAIVEQFGPEESVRQLIARANELGGPDNITAIIVRVSFDESSREHVITHKKGLRSA